jgi:N-acetylglutamate synthase
VLGPDHVGHRVVVRHIVGRRADRPLSSDVLGVLLAVSESEITVQTKGGPVRVPVAAVTAAKPVPDRRRLSNTEAVEFAAAHGWPAAESARLGDWWLRASGGWTMRGNSGLPVGEPGVPREAAIDAVVAWYRERGLPPAIAVPLPLRAGLDAELDRRGWVAEKPTLVMTAALAALDPPRRAEPVRMDRTPAPEWLAVAAARKGSLPEVALRVLTGVPDVRFPIVDGPGGAAVATARGVVADPRRWWLGLTLLEVAPAARRQGFARHVVGALADWARELGATQAYLQVEAANTAARALYARLGFTVHHRYVHRVLRGAGGGASGG